jgi:phosphohistidine phosphatase SixA
VKALLVRHARAGKRGEWDGDDRLRPVDEKGRRDADRLASRLAELGADRLLSSPYLRCVQTLEPTAVLLGIEIETRAELAEGASAAAVLGLLDELDSTPALSTHRDVIEALLGPQRKCKKGAVWVLEVEGGDVEVERYLAPA